MMIISACNQAACDQVSIYPKGGYPYPAATDKVDTDFYCYPVRNELSRRDSILWAWSRPYFDFFHEPNLSIKPMPKETFRFLYGGGFGDMTFITLTQNSLTIKKGYPGQVFAYDSLENYLSKQELLHYRILYKHFPFEVNAQRSPERKRYLDSLTHLYPQLLDVNYYISLKKKLLLHNEALRPYTTSTKPITCSQFNEIITAINQSGYWSLPHQAPNVCTAATDQSGFSLEANTRRQYHRVQSIDCEEDTAAFTKACQMIIDLAGLGKQIRVYRNDSK